MVRIMKWTDRESLIPRARELLRTLTVEEAADRLDQGDFDRFTLWQLVHDIHRQDRLVAGARARMRAGDYDELTWGELAGRLVREGMSPFDAGHVASVLLNDAETADLN